MAQDADSVAMGGFDSASSMDQRGPWRLVTIIIAAVLVAGIVYVLAQPANTPVRSTASTSATSNSTVYTVHVVNGTTSTIYETVIGPAPSSTTSLTTTFLSETVIGPAPSSTTSLTTTFLSETTIGPSTNDSQLPNGILLTSLANRGNALYGIPGPASYMVLMKEPSASEDIPAGVLFNYTVSYGLNFTSPIYYIFDTYSVALPSSYANAGYPLAIQVTVTNYTSTAIAQRQYSNLSNGNTTFYFYYRNNTRSTKLAPGSTNYKNITMVPSQVAFANGTTTMLTVSPDYQNYEQQRLLVKSGSYIVYISAYGALGKLNQSYVIDIGENIARQLR
ncbi:MAG: hypothetical protein KGH69_04795 [Candidatus Micrarchaeota archaeon]|nr:hypothetical protein [Candidatus Micrarchaeota archaeon]